MYRTAILAIGFYAVCSALTVVWVYFDAFEAALQSDRDAGGVRLSEAVVRLRGQLDVYRALVNIAAENPKVADALVTGDTAVSADLAQLKLTYGADRIELVDRGGVVIASSSAERSGVVYGRTLVRSALNGRLGYAVDNIDGRRLIRFSRRVKSPGQNARGVVVVSVDLAALEFEWPVTPEPIIFFGVDGLSISANRSNLLLYSDAGDPEEASFPLLDPRRVAGAELWTFVPPETGETEVQTMGVPIPQLQMKGLILLHTDAARATALVRASLAAALLLALALVGTVFWQQRRRLTMESRHSATLEHRVEERTLELRAAQDELVEASKLAALGRLSAGISHELNQPLAAILNFAENGRRLIGKERIAEASHNLSQITDQIRRINRIIGNLRTFARRERTPTERVDLTATTARALELAQPDISAGGVKASLSLPDKPLFVRAGKVRLEQIIINLVSNALDAMQESPEKHLTVELRPEAENAVLSVRDTGSGVKEPERVFEPFYTTKELGSSKGLGMGLALSFGLVASFGGHLSCRNRDRGAEFNMSLPLQE